MKPKIRFNWDGKTYEVDMKAYDLNRIILPDGRVLQAGKWLESLPPQPVELRENLHLYKGFPTHEIAEFVNGVLAEEVSSTS